MAATGDGHSHSHSHSRARVLLVCSHTGDTLLGGIIGEDDDHVRCLTGSLAGGISIGVASVGGAYGGHR